MERVESIEIMTVIADPPWKFADKLPGNGRGAEKHYKTLSPEHIAEVIAHGLARAGVDRDYMRLFLWRVSAMQAEALRVLELLDLVPKAEIVWVKYTRSGRTLHFGMGRRVRNAHEICIIAERGRVPVLSHSVRSVFFAPVGRHSEKPNAFFDLVEQLSPGPYLELFARRHHPGWLCVGDELNHNPKTHEDRI